MLLFYHNVINMYVAEPTNVKNSGDGLGVTYLCNS